MKLFRTVTMLLFTTALLAFSGCATLFSDSEDEVQFESKPAGAIVTLNGREIGKTPLKIMLKRKSENAAVTFSKDGYLPHTVDLTKDLAPAALFNFGFITTTFGATSWGIDAMSGKLFKYSNRAYVVELGAKHGAFYKPSALGFSIAQFDRLRTEVAKGKGESFSALCGIYGFGPARCEEFYSKVRMAGFELASAPHALAWFNTVDALAAM